MRAAFPCPGTSLQEGELGLSTTTRLQTSTRSSHAHMLCSSCLIFTKPNKWDALSRGGNRGPEGMPAAKTTPRVNTRQGEHVPAESLCLLQPFSSDGIMFCSSRSLLHQLCTHGHQGFWQRGTFSNSHPGPLLMVLMEEEPGCEPGPAATRTDLASQGYCRNPETEVLVLRNPQSTMPQQSLLLLHVATVVLATHNLELDTRQVLGAPPLYQHNVVLLQGVALSWDKADGFSAGAEPHAAALAVG